MEQNTQDQLTLFAGDSLANHFQLQDSSEAKTMTVTSGLKCYESSVSPSQDGSLEKMFLASSAWHSTMCRLTWKTKATPSGRLYYQLVPQTRNTAETGYSLWPTPLAHEARLGYQDRSRGKKGTQESLTTKVINDLGGRQAVTGQLNPQWQTRK